MNSKFVWIILLLLTVSVFPSHGAAQTHAVDGEYITEWILLGPFFPENLETDFLAGVGGEARVNPKAGDTITTTAGQS